MIIIKKHLFGHNNISNNNNQINENSGGSMTMKKKHQKLFNKVTSKSVFSINGTGKHTYIGNANNMIYSNCPTNNTNIYTSVKSSFGLRQTRIINQGNDIYCNPINSNQCQNKLFKDINGLDIIYNKHLRSENRSQSIYIEKKIENCNIEKDLTIINNNTCYENSNKNTTTIGHINKIKRTCNITKPEKIIKPLEYSDYLKKIKNCSNKWNALDMRVIAC
jgi:hypothetical protein